jgi:hypothetical protein
MSSKQALIKIYERLQQEDVEILLDPLRLYIDEMAEYGQHRKITQCPKLFSVRQLPFNVENNIFVVRNYPSSILKTPEAKEAHKKNPIRILVGFDVDRCSYISSRKVLWYGIPFRLICAMEKNTADQDGLWPYVGFGKHSISKCHFRIKRVAAEKIIEWLDYTKG